MSATKRTRVHSVGGGFDPKLIQAPTLDPCTYVIEEAISPTFDTTRGLLRRVFFVNEEKNRYVSVGFYPARNYQVLVEFGGPRIAPITLTDQHVRILVEHLPRLCEAICRGDHYTCKDDLFLLQSAGTYRAARMYLDKQFVRFKFADLRYMMNMLHIVQDHQTKYILAQNDVMAYAVAALGWIEFVEPPPTATNLILYDQLFDELKTLLI